MPKKPFIIAVVGPTSSGKTSFSIALAKAIGGEVVSVDSRQVYIGLSIGTGKVTPREMRGVPHHLLDIVSPKKIFTVSEFVVQARRAIEEIYSRGNVPILCGGTGLYLDATVGTISIPEVPPNLALRKQLEKKTVTQLYAQLKKLDPRRAAEIDAKNPVRLIRAIEIAKKLGKVPEKKAESLYECTYIGLLPKESELKKRIHTRLLARMRAGMINEAAKLHTQGVSFKRMAELGLEYRYLARYLQNKISKKEMLSELETEINKYAKRQMTWFKRNKNILWIDPKNSARTIQQIIKAVPRK